MLSLNKNRFGSRPLDFPSLLLGHSKLVGIAGSYSVSLPLLQCPMHNRRTIKPLKVVSAVVLDLRH